MGRRPPHLPHFSYTGVHAYFVTVCTALRRPAFLDPAVAEATSAQLLRTANREHFALTAYCVMPDHVHVLLAAQDERADFRRFVSQWRQATGYWWRRQHGGGGMLWQRGYWDWVLRSDEDPLRVAAYIVHNPVRAGLVQRVHDYRWLGSSLYTVEELAMAAQLRPGSRPT